MPKDDLAQRPFITFASGNRHKLDELTRLFDSWHVNATLRLDPDYPADLDETGDTFLDNAILKAMAASVDASLSADVLQFILAEDSGMVVPALDGRYGISPFPGLQSNRWLTPTIRQALLAIPEASGPVTDRDKCQGILALMEGVTDRSAYYTCTMVLLDASKTIAAHSEGRLSLEVTASGVLKGHGGFGYDPIMHPMLDGVLSPLTVAELSLDEKNRISHRMKALEMLISRYF